MPASAPQVSGINSPAVREFFTNLLTKYNGALQAEPDPWMRELSGFQDTAALISKYEIDLTQFDGFREWVGELDVKDVDFAAFFVESKPWERSIKVDVDAVESGQFSQYYNRIPAFTAAAVSQANRIIADLLKNGQTAGVKGFDGVSLFSASHPVDLRNSKKGVQPNLVTGNNPFSQANLAIARKMLRSMKAPDGRTSLGYRLTHVFAPTDQEEAILDVAERSLIATDTSGPGGSGAAGQAMQDNRYKGSFKPVIATELDGDKAWYGVALNTSARPFETQMKNGGAPEIKILGDGSEYATTNNKMLFRGKLFGNACVALPLTIVRFEYT